MNFKILKYLGLTLSIFAGITSCKVSQKYSVPETGYSNNYRDTTVVDTSSMAQMQWQDIISDSVLQNLIEEGLENNLDLKYAIQNIYQAEATLQQAKLTMFPSLEGGAQVTRSKSSKAALNFPDGIDINLKTTTYEASLSSSWEIDVWGKLRSNKRAALAAFLSSEASTRAVQTQLIADIASYYYNLLALDEQLRITKQTLENRKVDQETMKALKESAVVDGAAVVQSEASRYQVEVSIPDIEVSIRETENALSILLGREPGRIERTSLEVQQAISDLEIGVPSSLLINRPDIQAAELAFRNAFENTNVARKYFYPSLTLTASGGLSSLDINNFFNQSIFYSIIGGLTQPIFAQGENKARLKTNEALQQQAFYDYKLTWLTATEEVSNALFSYNKAIEKQTARTNQITALEKSVEFTKSLLEYSSSTNYTDVLTSQQNLLSAQISGINDKLQELEAIIQLYRALGGGWK
ncbi:MAG: hypothetical protein CMO01_25905 [Thalassobius sp.]|nr:hypothetical protein [Thalassovita sp.]